MGRTPPRIGGLLAVSAILEISIGASAAAPSAGKLSGSSSFPSPKGVGDFASTLATARSGLSPGSAAAHSASASISSSAVSLPTRSPSARTVRSGAPDSKLGATSDSSLNPIAAALPGTTTLSPATPLGTPSIQPTYSAAAQPASETPATLASSSDHSILQISSASFALTGQTAMSGNPLAIASQAVGGTANVSAEAAPFWPPAHFPIVASAETVSDSAGMAATLLQQPVAGDPAFRRPRDERAPGR